MKKISAIILLLLCFFTTTFASVDIKVEERTETDLKVRPEVNRGTNIEEILSTPKVDESEKIYDFADLLTEEEEQSLKTQVDEYIEETNFDLCVVTIDENPKYSAREYAADFYDYNYFGKSSDNAGVILLLDMYNRELYMVGTGSAMEYYNDSRCVDCTDAGVPYLKSELYKSALENTINKVYNYYTEGPGNKLKKSPVDFFPCLIGGGVINLVLILINVSKHKGIRQKTTATQYLNKDTADINDRRDQFLTTHTSRVSRQSSSGRGGGGGFSGSSGVSHSGGGSRF